MAEHRCTTARAGDEVPVRLPFARPSVTRCTGGADDDVGRSISCWLNLGRLAGRGCDGLLARDCRVGGRVVHERIGAFVDVIVSLHGQIHLVAGEQRRQRGSDAAIGTVAVAGGEGAFVEEGNDEVNARARAQVRS